jgi:hypothetical protein
MAALVWIRAAQRGGSAVKSRPVVNWTTAFCLLLVLVAFAFTQLEEARHQRAFNKLALEHQAKEHALREQTESSHRASEQLKAAWLKHHEAFKGWLETSQKVKLPDGQPGFRPTSEATRKFEEAKAELERAQERDRAERDRLLRIQHERLEHEGERLFRLEQRRLQR